LMGQKDPYSVRQIPSSKRISIVVKKTRVAN
jgi:hypothetical protein